MSAEAATAGSEKRRARSLSDLVSGSSILICCGSGGVGKTTVAAALAVHSAHLGRRSCVVTIDPARRLADALGLEGLSNEATRIGGPWPGELWGLMLDSKGTFDDLVRRYADDEEQARNILSNRMYRNLSGALSGTQEYMAAEKLYELNEEGRFDLIVVDTPPTRNALDFLEAPGRLTRFLENRIFRLLMMPTRAYLKAVSLATQAFLRTVSKVVGAEAVQDAVAFFQAFEGMEDGFRERAAHVEKLISDPSTAYVLVASPRRDTVDEATFFAEKLDELGMGVSALVVNRAHPRFGHAKQAGPRDPLRSLWKNLADFETVAEHEDRALATLTAKVYPAPVTRVPLLSSDVHDLEGLELMDRHLFGESAQAKRARTEPRTGS